MTTVFIISAPSGSGKSTLTRELLERVPKLRFSVSYTTRAPRGQERERPGVLFHLPRGVRGTGRQGRIPGTRRGLRQLLRHPCQRTGPRGQRGRGPGARHRRPGCATIEREDSGRGVDFYSCAEPGNSGTAVAGAEPGFRSGDRAPAARRRGRDSAIIRNYDYVLVNREVEASVDTLVSIVKATRSRRDRMEEQIQSDSGDV